MSNCRACLSATCWLCGVIYLLGSFWHAGIEGALFVIIALLWFILAELGGR